jgi:hypothetical protein
VFSDRAAAIKVPEGKESGLVVRPSIPGGEGTLGHLWRAYASPVNITKKVLIQIMCLNATISPDYK